MKNLLSFIFLLLINFLYCQNSIAQYSESNIYKLKLRLEDGDKKAFYELAPFFDRHKKLVEFLGYHYLETKESDLAKRIFKENFIFPEDEKKINEINSTKEYLIFLNLKRNKLKYSKDLATFYINPIVDRKENIKFRELPKAKIEKLNQTKTKILNEDWLKKTNIKFLIEKKNPECLLKICQEFYRKRDRFNSYNYNKKYYYDLLQLLIQKDIGAVGRDNSFTWDANDYNFDNNSILNILIYFTKNYQKFRWNENENHFVNSNLQSKSIDNISNLFENLYSENDTLALNSFVKLSQSNPIRVNELAKEKEKNFLDNTNYKIPIFPFRFLSQLSIFTEYCRKNNIDYIGDDKTKSIIEKLSSNLSFVDRRKFENQLINQLTLNDLTPLEFWSLIDEKKSELSTSISRILDVFYTKNWTKLLSDNNQLELYLKKSLLFSKIGINGNLNYYLIKFLGNGPQVIKVLNAIKSDDSDINVQVEKSKKLCLQAFTYPINHKKFNDANFNSEENNIQNEIDKIRFKSEKQDDFEYAVLQLLAKINYAQIPEAIKIVENLKFDERNYRDKYSFLERDFGFFTIENWKSKEVRNQFLSVYKTHGEKQLYRYYLDLPEIDYKNIDESLNYDKIFEILKFNIITPFTGRQEYENEVGAIIKVLELELNTRLGYPDKLCNSAGIYSCPPSDRAWEWQKYLMENKLLKFEHSPIVSFNYGYYIDKVLPYKK